MVRAASFLCSSSGIGRVSICSITDVDGVVAVAVASGSPSGDAAGARVDSADVLAGARLGLEWGRFMARGSTSRNNKGFESCRGDLAEMSSNELNAQSTRNSVDDREKCCKEYMRPPTLKTCAIIELNFKYSIFNTTYFGAFRNFALNRAMTDIQPTAHSYS
eukprot:5031395-Amphidinium_carterae.1